MAPAPSVSLVLLLALGCARHDPLHLTPGAGSDGGADTATDTAGDTATPPAPCTDLNCDGWPDLVVSNADQVDSQVYWGGPDGFVDMTPIPITFAKGNLLTDIDGDGDLDVVISRLMDFYDELGHYGTNSVILYTDTLSPWTYHTVELPTIGSPNVAAADFDHDGTTDLVFTNHTDGGTYELPAFIYWNGPDGFSADRRSDLPATGGHGVSATDIDGDGWADVVISSYYNGHTRNLDSYVYWGGPDGFSTDRRTSLPTHGPRENLVVDLNDDGWNDIVFANHYDDVNMDIDSVVYWGSADGFDATRNSTFPTYGADAVAAVDADHDGYRDLFFANQRADSQWVGTVQSWLYPGTADGWPVEGRRVLDTHGAAGVSVRDLDGDGWEELVVCNFREHDTVDNPSYIYAGGPDGWSDDARVELPTYAADSVSSGPVELGF